MAASRPRRWQWWLWGGGRRKMAALQEGGRYGVSCGRISQDNITVLHVKLTETAFRALENYQGSKVRGDPHPLLPARPRGPRAGGSRWVSCGRQRGGRAGQGRAGRALLLARMPPCPRRQRPPSSPPPPV